MKALVFQRDGVQVGGYLAGLGRYASAVRLLTAELTCTRNAPVGGVLRLELEVNGALTGLAFNVPPSGGELRQSLPLGLAVAAGAVIRWKATFTGQTAEAATNVSITVSAAGTVLPPPTLAQVIWTDGSARLPVANYSNGAYQSLTDNSLAAVAVDGSTIWLGGLVVLTATGDGLQAAAFREGLPAQGPRLEFWLGTQRVGVLSAAGMQAQALSEGTPSGAGFAFGTVASLDATGLTATQLIEGDQSYQVDRTDLTGNRG
ncbi:MAG TPA: hypothetical protein VMU04_10180 [Candidatus Acidoferrum sp.]|nr:hypothetical protein [Candidatus Acidoferrum sp.]